MLDSLQESGGHGPKMTDRVSPVKWCRSCKEKTVMTGKVYSPGEKVPNSGQADIVGPRGGTTGKQRTVVKGEPFPPTPERGQGYQITDRTKH